MKTTKTFKIQDREAGNVIVTGLNFKEGLKRIREYEKEDKLNGFYVSDFYELVEENEKLINLIK